MASRDPATPSCPFGPESPRLAAAPSGCPVEGSWPAPGAGGAEVPVVTVDGTDAVAGAAVLSWSVVGTGLDAGGAGTCAGWVGWP
jgi:hypothetical protein